MKEYDISKLRNCTTDSEVQKYVGEEKIQEQCTRRNTKGLKLDKTIQSFVNVHDQGDPEYGSKDETELSKTRKSQDEELLQKEPPQVCLTRPG